MTPHRIPVEPTDNPFAAIVAPDGGDLQARYDQMAALVTRMAVWLGSPQAQLLSAEDWGHHFERYREQMEALATLGDELRPQVPERAEPLPGDALTSEVLELFAA